MNNVSYHEIYGNWAQYGWGIMLIKFDSKNKETINLSFIKENTNKTIIINTAEWEKYVRSFHR